MPKGLTQEDIWGQWSTESGSHKLLKRGMIVAQGFGECSEKELAGLKIKTQVSNLCPVWKDILPYKSVTVICKQEQEEEVRAGLEYVHGFDCVEDTKVLDDGRLAIRSNYMCW